ncbi:MAG TPA: hypothetical protein VMV46_20090 [Thermoanaerobaculia bacterium]|nr:hypothetical protein [Thermoanaerobaculia bacterium]
MHSSAPSRARPPRLATLLGIALPTIALAQPAPAPVEHDERCSPCVGIRVPDPAAAAATLVASPRIAGDETLFVAWRVELSDPQAVASARAALPALQAAGARPWIEARFRTAPPLLERGQELESELRSLAELARLSGRGAAFQLLWTPFESGPSALSADYSYLIKRAAVAVTGAQPDAAVVSAPLPKDRELLRALYDDELAAYLDGASLDASTGTADLDEATVADLVSLDPGALIVAQSIPVPDPPVRILARAAQAAGRGATVVLFDGDALDAEVLAPLRLLARELRGDVSFDPYSTPQGAPTWSFVRGSDLALRVVVEPPPGAGQVALDFGDPLLTSPALLDPATGEAQPLYGGRRTRGGYRLELSEPPPALMLAFDRQGVGTLEGVEGVEEQVVVEDVRQMPVAEILRRLQAFEDAQARRLETYTATNTTSLRFQVGTGVQSLDVTFSGDYFFRQGEPSDWAWDQLHINGVRWTRKRIPEIPLIQPEKASTMPLEITFTREYRYRLRGTGTVRGRDCWVVDFSPAAPVGPGDTLFRGTVWVDRELFARVRTRAVQLGLQGEVLSNDETLDYQPIDAAGQPAPWSEESYFLPLRTIGQQLFSILNGTTVVERQVTLSDVAINPADFEARRRAKLASPATMLRDTAAGLRYLVADGDDGERVVQEELDKTRAFLVGGMFYDRSLDYPLPLAGINWLSFDWRDTGTQVNVFFAGALITLDAANPSLFGSKFDAGVDLFALAIPGTDSIFRGNREASEEDVQSIRPNIDLTIGRPLGQFSKLDLGYSFGWNKFTRADDTADELVLPEDHFDHTFTLTGRYNRAGYRLRAQGAYTARSDWEPWGLPGNTDFDPDHQRYARWGASLGKTWHLPSFQKVGLELEYAGGENLDRFSKYQFGYFSGIRVHGYRQDRVRAEEAWAAHASYGFDVLQLFRVDLVADVAWATDETAGFDQETLAGVGISGTFVGPWSTVINLDVGTPIDGPDDGWSAFIAFLKLFR